MFFFAFTALSLHLFLTTQNIYAPKEPADNILLYCEFIKKYPYCFPTNEQEKSHPAPYKKAFEKQQRRQQYAPKETKNGILYPYSLPTNKLSKKPLHRRKTKENKKELRPIITDFQKETNKKLLLGIQTALNCTQTYTQNRKNKAPSNSNSPKEVNNSQNFNSDNIELPLQNLPQKDHCISDYTN